ncbi:hypothetical protein BH23GEM4_BH23GEM4_16790 [soil metagenome]
MNGWFGRSRSLGRVAPAVLLLLAGCNLQDDGYEKISYREMGVPTPPSDPQPLEATAATFAALTGGSAGPVTPASFPAGVDQAMVDQGQQLYGTVCVACHMPGGVGGPVAPALNDDEWIWIDGSYPEIDRIIAAGVPQPREHPGAMPPLGGGSFDAEQVRALAAYVYALSNPAPS